MFLSNAELKELTTYTHRKKQCEQLSKMGYAFTVRPIDGKPLVLASLVEARHGGKGKQRRAEPDLSHLEHASDSSDI